MSFLSGKQAFLQILKDEGVDTMFGNPGTTELPLMDGLAREPGIRYILALQEAPAIAMTVSPFLILRVLTVSLPRIPVFRRRPRRACPRALPAPGR